MIKKCVSNNVICVSNIVRSVLITMLGHVLLTMLQRVAGASVSKANEPLVGTLIPTGDVT